MKNLLFILILSLTSSLLSASEINNFSELLSNEEYYEFEDQIDNTYDSQKGSLMHLCSAIGWTYGRFNRTIGVGRYKREASRNAFRKCKSIGAGKCKINDCWRQRRRRR